MFIIEQIIEWLMCVVGGIDALLTRKKDLIVSVTAIIAAAAAVVTAKAALPGLRNWRQVEKWRANSLMAYKLRSSLDEIKEKIDSYRESSADVEKNTAEGDENIWNLVQEALQELESISSEADDLWSSNMQAQAKELAQFLQPLKDITSGGDQIFSEDQFLQFEKMVAEFKKTIRSCLKWRTIFSGPHFYFLP